MMILLLIITLAFTKNYTKKRTIPINIESIEIKNEKLGKNQLVIKTE